MIAPLMEPHSQPRKTPLTGAHQRLGAKLIDFGGWLMPVNYPDGIIEEHKATRGAVGVFDVCHMGEIHFRGARAAEAVQRLVTGNVGAMSDGRAMYAVACHPTGGIVDDLIVYRVAHDHFLMVVNASNIDKDHRHFVENAGALCQIDNQSDSTALIAFQGPKAAAALAGLTNADLASLRSFCFLPDSQVAGRNLLFGLVAFDPAGLGWSQLDERLDILPRANCGACLDNFAHEHEERDDAGSLVIAGGESGGDPVRLEAPGEPAPLTPRAVDTAGAQSLASAGVKYADQMLQQSALGADWRPPFRAADGTESATDPSTWAVPPAMYSDGSVDTDWTPGTSSSSITPSAIQPSPARKQDSLPAGSAVACRAASISSSRNRNLEGRAPSRPLPR